MHVPVCRLPQLIAAALTLMSLQGFVGLPGADAPTVMTYIYNAPEASYIFEYDREILRTALERTKEKYGPYRMQPSEPMSHPRQAHELTHATGTITVMIMAPRPAFERDLICIHIPIDRGLIGYRVFLIRREMQDAFRAVTTLDELRRFSYGLGQGWTDVDILQQNGFTVLTGSTYDGLFEMLAHQRFDAFPRGAVEVLADVEQHGAEFPELCIEESICLCYPLPIYFWFSKTAEGRHLAARTEEGMRMMIADGTYDRIFDRHQRHKIEALQLKERKLFRIEDPLLGPETPLADKRLWFDPQTYKPSEVSP